MIRLSSAKSILRIILLAFLVVSCKSDLELTSGLKGRVIRGPVNGGPEINGEINYEPFSAFFHITDQNNSSKRSFTSDKNGEFSIELPPGDYVIIPDETASLLMPEMQSKEVTVNEDFITSIILYFDTGIR